MADTQAPRRRRVLILYTGGTAGMQDSSEGFKPVAGFLTEQIAEMPEMKNPEMPLCEIKEYSPLLDSSDMCPEDWLRIAKDIEDHYDAFDGFVVLHGTDTMAYTSSALSFMLESLSKTIVFTGSCVPLVQIHSDARRNILVSVVIAARTCIPEVCIYFDNKLLRANRSRKVDAWGLGAFDSVTFPPLATLGFNLKINKTRLLPMASNGALKVHRGYSQNIAVIKLVPGFSDEVLKNVLQPPLEGVVLELYGTGNAPSRKDTFLDTLHEATRRGVIICVTSQCQKGAVVLETYSTGRRLQQIGVVSGADMTTEAAVTKLGFLLGLKLSPESVKKQLAENLRGELTPNPRGPTVHNLWARL